MPRVLVTAGPTHEPIDRVRYIGNRSSGRMGIAIAQACAARDWPVTLLLGPIGNDPPLDTQIALHRFHTAADLQRLLESHWPKHDVLLMAAAVADFTVAATSATEKIKRPSDRLTLELVATPDLLAALALRTRPNQMVVGFALEPAAHLDREAARKLKSKRLDAIVANPLETMDAADITAKLVMADGSVASAPIGMAKRAFAEWLLDRLAPSIIDRMSR